MVHYGSIVGLGIGVGDGQGTVGSPGDGHGVGSTVGDGVGSVGFGDAVGEGFGSEGLGDAVGEGFGVFLGEGEIVGAGIASLLLRLDSSASTAEAIIPESKNANVTVSVSTFLNTFDLLDWERATFRGMHFRLCLLSFLRGAIESIHRHAVAQPLCQQCSRLRDRQSFNI